MRDDREDPLDPPPSPTLGATAESDARVDALIARVLREGQDDDSLGEDDDEDEDTRDAPPPAALITPPQKRRNTAPPAASAKRQTPTKSARKFAPPSRALPQQPTQSPGRKLVGFEVARQYTCPGDVGGQRRWTKGVVTAFHDDDEHWGETYDVSMEDDMDDHGVTFEELLLILANEADKKSVVSEQSWALALGILRMADPTQAVRTFRKERHSPNARFAGFDTLVHPDGAECYEAKIQDANGGKHHFAFHFPTKWGAAAAHEILARRLEFHGPGVKGWTRRNFAPETPWEALVGVLIAGATWTGARPEGPGPSGGAKSDGTPASGDPASNSPESVIGTDDGVGEDERPIHEVVKRERKPARRFSTDYVLENKPPRKRKTPPQSQSPVPIATPKKGKERRIDQALDLTTRGMPRKMNRRFLGVKTSSDVTIGGKRIARCVGSSEFFGVRWAGSAVKPGARPRSAKPWQCVLNVTGAGKAADIGLGSYVTAREAALAYDAEVRRRGWEHLKPTNFAPPADPAHVPPRHELSAAMNLTEKHPVILNHLRVAMSGVGNPIVGHRVTETGNGERAWRRAEVKIRYLIPTPKSPHMNAAEHHRWVLLKDVAGVLNGWDKLVDYIRRHKRRLEEDVEGSNKIGPGELPASAPLFTLFTRHYDSGQSCVCVLGGFEPYDPDGYPHYVVVCDGDTEDLTDNELRGELGLTPGPEPADPNRYPNPNPNPAEPRANPYAEFCREIRHKILAVDPTMPHTRVNRRLGELWRKKKAGGGCEKTADSPKPGEITAAAAAAADDDDDDDDDDCPLAPVKRERSDDGDDAGPEIVAALDRILREVDLTRTTTNMVIRRLEDELPVTFNLRHHKLFLKEKIKAWVDENVDRAIPNDEPKDVPALPAPDTPTDSGLRRAKLMLENGVIDAEDYEAIKTAWMKSLGG
ncbi:predicted protein [Micromonas commoda]|uniref:DEK-C domain-containing protein n=1 Tax=Micromonas commoda (strain RCC299 / NOUM17 / CCMP2709) TaxID=296587 RepID=C1EFD9_MICCC|nr:predicted protein [Micromonas commoda]ACO67069.1 predicted protein [Micromonas commoda]|eukprot:XP_002505811.1 predicted protein [Micromonas commoda]